LRQALQETSFRFRPEEELLKSNWPTEFYQTTVAEVMTTPVEIISAECTVAEAFEFHAICRRGSLPLVGSDGKLVGLITRTDLYRAVLENRDLQAPAMTLSPPHVLTLHSSQSLREVLGLFRRKRLKHAPVVDEAGKPVGMLSYVDIVLAGLKMRQHPVAATVTESPRAPDVGLVKNE
jgi:CBS domain-containing protein